MPKIPAKVQSRIREALKRFQPIIEQAKSRDIGEADTSTLVKDILAEVFGYDKYTEITAEYQIKSTYCDLALKIEGKLALLIEVKAIGLELKDNYVKQAVDYAANQGIEWVILTNAYTWCIYKVGFGKPITHELLITINIITLNPKSDAELEPLYLLSREAQGKSLLDEFSELRQALSKYYIGGLLLTEPILSVIRRELKRLSNDVKIELEEILVVLSQDVIKREVIEGDKAVEAAKKISRAATRMLRSKTESEQAQERAEPTPFLSVPTVNVPIAAANTAVQL